MVTVCWFSSFWHHFNFVKLVKFGVPRHFLNTWREWPEILHADVSWPLSEIIRLWSRSVDFFSFWCPFDLRKGSNFGFPGNSRRTHGGNGLKFCMLMYTDHLQNWLDYGRGLDFLHVGATLTYRNWSIWGFWAFSWECMGGVAWILACWCIPTFRTD